MHDIGIFDVDDTLRLGVSDWKYGGRLGQLLFPEDTEMQQAFNQVVSEPDGRLLNRRAWLAQAHALCGRPIDDSEISVLVESFGRFIQLCMLDETYLHKKVPRVLHSLRLNNFRLYAVSGASHQNVCDAMVHDNLSSQLDGFYGHGWDNSASGSGLGKAEAVRNILHLHNMSSFVGTRSFVVGDGDSDLALASEFQLPFYGIITKWNGWGTNPPQYDKLTLLLSVDWLLCHL